MTTLAAIAAVLALASAPVALAQSQGQLEAQQGQMPRTPSAGQPTLDRSHNVDPGGRTPITRADDGRNNPPPDPKK